MSGVPVSRTINVSVIGYGASTPTPPLHVGKSCLIQRFMNRVQYTEDHLSIISNSDYYSSVIATQSWIYWGSRELKVGSNNFLVRIIEQCEFFDDHLFAPYDKSSYIERCFVTHVRIDSPKVAYFSKDQVGHEWKYPRDTLENCDFFVDAFIIVFDPTLAGLTGETQKKFLKVAISKMKEVKIPFVIASTKHDSTPVPENIKYINDLLKKHTRYHGKLKYSRVELSARFGINVEQTFLAAVALCAPQDHNIIGKYFAFPSLSPTTNENQCSTSTRSHARPADIVTLYMSSTLSPAHQSNEGVLVRPLQRLSLAYDLPIEMNSGSSNSSMKESASSAPANGNFAFHRHHHICNHLSTYEQTETVVATLNPPAPRLPAVRTHFIPIRPITCKEYERMPSSRHCDQAPCVLVLFLCGPGATEFKMHITKRQQRDCFELSSGQSIRFWIRDALDSFAGQTSPPRGHPSSVLRPSPSAPSAFSTPVQGTSVLCRRQSLGDDNSNCYLKLRLWVTSGTGGDEYSSNRYQPSNVDAVMFRSCLEEPNDCYYDQISGDQSFEFKKAFDLAKACGVALIFTSESIPNTMLRTFYLFTKFLPFFTTCTNQFGVSGPPIFLSDISDVRLSFFTQICNSEPVREDLSSIPYYPAGWVDTDLAAFRVVPRVALGLLLAGDEGVTQSPLVSFTTIYQALEILARYTANATGSVCFIALHFNTPQWPRFCGELTSQLGALLQHADDCLGRQRLGLGGAAAADRRPRCVLLLVAFGADNASRARQLLHAFSARNSRLLWTPKSRTPPAIDNERQQITHGPKTSLAFLHLQSDSDEDFRCYQQAMRGEMFDWQASYSPTFASFMPSSSEVRDSVDSATGDNPCRPIGGTSLCGGSSPSLLPRHHLNQNDCFRNAVSTSTGARCCAFTISGRGHNDYADTEPETFDMSSDVSSRLLSPLLVQTAGLSGGDDTTSEQYAEVTDLTSGMNDPPLQPVSDRPRRPQNTGGPHLSTASSSAVSLLLSSATTTTTAATASHRNSCFLSKTSKSTPSTPPVHPPCRDFTPRFHPLNSDESTAATTGRSFSDLCEFVSPRLMGRPPPKRHLDGAGDEEEGEEDAYEMVYEEPILRVDRALLRRFGSAYSPRRNGSRSPEPICNQASFAALRKEAVPTIHPLGVDIHSNPSGGCFPLLLNREDNTCGECSASYFPTDSRPPLQNLSPSLINERIIKAVSATNTSTGKSDRPRTIAGRFGHALKRGGEAIRGLSTKFLKDRKEPP